MTTDITTTDMTVFTPAEIKRAGELLQCPLDEASAIRALIIQRDTGLSITRGEISIVPFAGKPTVMINKQGYLAYATKQPEYDGYESSVSKEGNEWVAECSVFHKTRRPTKVKIYEKEFSKSTPIWKEKPRYMLEKTAISLALRAAFPILNGTYEEGEIEPDVVKIQQKPTDINVEPEAALPPISEQYTMKDAQTVLNNMISQGMKTDIFNHAKLSNGNYNKKMINEDFKRQLEEKKKSTVDKVSTTEKHTAPPAEESSTTRKILVREPCDTNCSGYPDNCQNCNTIPVLAQEPKTEEQQTTCPICGKPSMTANELQSLQAAASALGIEQTFDPTICKECGQKWWKKSISRDEEPKQEQEPEPHTEEDIPVCSVCGKPLSKMDMQLSTLFAPGEKMKCQKCMQKK